MKVLCVGDVVGTPGVQFLCRRLPRFKQSLGVDVCIVNGENADPSGKGITADIAEELMHHGADVITTGNHCFFRAGDELYDEQEFLLCPANFPGAVDNGWCELDFGRYAVQVINLSGLAFLEPLANPFELVDTLLAKSNARFRIVDFHAESTAEKLALSYYLDGRVSAVFGTHTHVPTADARVLPQGTGHITDVGMTGPLESVLGVVTELAIAKQKNHRPVRFAVAKGRCRMDTVLFTLDDTTGRCLAAEQILEAER